jgi:WASH complex subunit strumpellin
MIRKLVSEKAQIWGDDRDTCYEYINEIAEFFSGNRQWAKEGTVENQQYADWFKLNADTIMTLDYKKSNKTGVKIQNLVQALEDIQVYDIIDTSVQIKHNI